MALLDFIFGKSKLVKKTSQDPFIDSILGEDYGSVDMGLNELLDSTTPRYDRSAIYSDVDFIDKFDEVVARHLTDMSEDATQHSPITNQSFWAVSEDRAIQDALTKLFERLEISEKAPLLCRSMIKYGDKFGRLIVDPEEGVKSLKTNIHPSKMIRLEYLSRLVGFHKEGDISPLQRWEVVHWKTPSEYVYDDIIKTRSDLFQRYLD